VKDDVKKSDVRIIVEDEVKIKEQAILQLGALLAKTGQAEGKSR
jgi:hypothetical protein